MSPCFEFEDKSVEKAVQKACDELNIPREELKHDVISHGSTGIFGLVGTKKARIRVTIAEPEPGIDPETRDKAPGDGPLQKAEPVKPETPSTEGDYDCEIFSELDEPIKIGQEALQRIIDLITSDATISTEEQRGRILFKVNGGNSGVLIGKRGQTLEAIQYLVEKIVNKQRDERVRIQVDVEGYLENRRSSLQKLAGRMAEKVKRTGRPATIGQMNAHDRRIIHMALKNNNAVRTQSMGEGYIRKLVIFPKKNSNRKKKPYG
jgi:spoIIIJ-associated protein